MNTFSNYSFFTPQKSPSPDLTNSNAIQPTYSPPKREINIHKTLFIPFKSIDQSKTQQSKIILNKPINPFEIIINQKQQNDNTLKNKHEDHIQLSENNISKKESKEQKINYENLTQQNSINKIQNDSTFNQLSKKSNHNIDITNNQILQRNYNNKESFERVKQEASNNSDYLNQKINKLTTELKQIKEKNILLDNQNTKLLKLLKQKDESQRKIYNTMLQQKNKIIHENLLTKINNKPDVQRISTIKQYYQNKINQSKILFEQQIQKIMEFVKIKNTNIFKKIANLQNKLQAIYRQLIIIKFKSNKLTDISHKSQFQKLNYLVSKLVKQKQTTDANHQKTIRHYEQIVETLKKNLQKEQNSNKIIIDIVNHKNIQLQNLQRKYQQIINNQKSNKDHLRECYPYESQFANQSKIERIKFLQQKLQNFVTVLQQFQQKFNNSQIKVIKLNHQLIQKTQIQKQLHQKIDQLQDESILFQKRSKQMQVLFKQKLIQKQELCEKLIQTIESLKNRNSVEDLNEVKNMIDLSEIQKIEFELQKINSKFNQVTLQLQQKTSQIQQIKQSKIKLEEYIQKIQKENSTLTTNLNQFQIRQKFMQQQVKSSHQLYQSVLSKRQNNKKEQASLKQSEVSNNLLPLNTKKLILAVQMIDNLIKEQSQFQY